MIENLDSCILPSDLLPFGLGTFLREQLVIWWRMLLKESHLFAITSLHLEVTPTGFNSFGLWFYLPFHLPIGLFGDWTACTCFCRIYLMGQSAGAHISACALLEQAIKESKEESISWRVSQIKAYFGLSGGYLLNLFLCAFWYTAIDLLIILNLNRYNLYNLVDHFHNRGLYRSIFLR